MTEKETKRRVTALLDANQYRELEILMDEDRQTSFTHYIVFLIMQEKKRRDGVIDAGVKKAVGRPKKNAEAEENTSLYPAPYDGGGAYTRNELESYYAFRGEQMPPLPKPLSAEEVKKYE